MKKYWFHKLLYSYLPIFVILISLLVFLFALLLSDQVKKQAIQANLAGTEQAMQSVDYSLQSIHETIMKEIRNNDNIEQFFNETASYNPVAHAKASDMLNSLVASNGLISSIYMYRVSDHKVLSTRMMADIGQFGDRAFAIEAYNDKKLTNWTAIRDFRDDSIQPNSLPVVSLVRRYPVLEGSSGILVVNVDARAVQKAIDGMTGTGQRFMDLYDGGGRIFFDKKDQFSDVSAAEPNASRHQAISTVKSSLTGWELRSGFVSLRLFDVASMLTNVWVLLGCGAIVLGILFIVYFSHRNYKPIELILRHIHSSAVRAGASPPSAETDEFKQIAIAIDNLVERSDQYKRRHDEDLIYRRQHFFQELMEGSRKIGSAEWNRELGLFGLNGDAERLLVTVIEIDQYADFCGRYSQPDRLLLKYALDNVVNETMKGASIGIWAEWTSNRHLTALLLLNGRWQEKAALVQDVCETMREWVRSNLSFTVTFGIGKLAEHIDEIVYSSEEAFNALKYKPVLGGDKIIPAADFPPQPQSELYRILQSTRATVQSFRLNEERWQEELARFFDGLREGVWGRDDIVNLLNYMYFQLEREMTELSPELQAVWREQAASRLTDAIRQFELLEEAREEFHTVLVALAGKLAEARQGHQHHQQIRDIKSYLEANFANPDLSLDYISSRFELNPKTFSRLFKEELGEKFAEFLAGVRVQEAKRLLLESDEPVQTIALKVGYEHPLSFIRMFKKSTGMTPGYFRSGQPGGPGEKGIPTEKKE
ncbi:AraC family transcriptional regulator [Paenibacillus hodogayensis]|uniref:AraC family transcriptional regulator n=1 Tax=Paenibacillus hodogayensis TaxID=279208 RepID=A0ABV5VRS8_9BACL